MASSKHQAIGFWRGWGIAVGCAIGSGIFMMPTQLAPYGMLGLMGWFTAGAGALLVALSLSRMAQRIPKEGGPYAYAYAGLGQFAAFIIAWSYYISCIAAAAAIAVAFTGYLSYFFPVLGQVPLYSLLVTLSLIWGLTLLNLRGVEGSTTTTFVASVLKILPILLVIVLGFWEADATNLPEWNPTEDSDMKVIGLATILVMWAFLGIETATVPADEMVTPEKTIPRVMVASILTLLVVYLAVSFAVAYVMPAENLAQSTSPFALVAEKLMGPIGAKIIVCGVLVATFSSTNGNLFTAPHMLVAAAQDGLFPARFAKKNAKGIPVLGFLVTAGIISVMLSLNFTKNLADIFTGLVLLSTLATLLSYVFTAVAELYFLKQEGRSAARTRAIILSLAAFAYSLFAIWGAGADYVMYSFMLILIGAPFFALMRKVTPTGK